MMMTIGSLGRAAGVKVPTIRYYEEIGLMPEPERSPGNQRLYPETMLSRLSFIRHARELGFPLTAIRDLLRLAAHPEQPCDAADQIAHEQLNATRARIARLRALETELERMVASGTHGTVGECRVIEVLGNHELCAQDHGTEPENGFA